MRDRSASLLLCLAGALAFAASASAARPLLGIHGNAERFQALTGQRSQVEHVLMGWGQVTGRRLDRMIENLGEIPMLGLKTGPAGSERITPGQIALWQAVAPSESVKHGVDSRSKAICPFRPGKVACADETSPRWRPKKTDDATAERT